MRQWGTRRWMVWACSATLVVATAVVAGAQGRPTPNGNGSDAFDVFGLGSTLGISVDDPSQDALRAARLNEAGGAVVVRVNPDSPGQQAGLAVGDVIVEYDGERVRSAQQLVRLVRETPAGRRVTCTAVRSGDRRTFDVTPVRRSAMSAFPPLPDIRRDVERSLRNVPRQFDFDFDVEEWAPSLPFGARGRLGATLSPLGDQLARYFGVKQGLLVTFVATDSPAGRAGLIAGDVLTAVDGQAVSRSSEVAARVRRADPGAVLTLTITRDKKEQTLTVTLPSDGAPARGRAI